MHFYQNSKHTGTKGGEARRGEIKARAFHIYGRSVNMDLNHRQIIQSNLMNFLCSIIISFKSLEALG